MPNTRDGFKLLPSSIGVPRGEDGGRGDPALRPEHGLPHQGAHQGKILIDIIMDKGVLGDCINLDSVLFFVTLCYLCYQNGEEESTGYWGTKEKVLAKLALRLHMVGYIINFAPSLLIVVVDFITLLHQNHYMAVFQVMKFNTHAITEAVLESKDRPVS